MWTAVEGLWTTLLACAIAGQLRTALNLPDNRAKPGEVVSRSARWARSLTASARNAGEKQREENQIKAIHRLWITCGQAVAAAGGGAGTARG